MQSYPINLLLQNRLCLVVGGGSVALRKATRLLAAAARVKVVAPDAVAGLHELAAAGRLELILRKCQDNDLNGIFLLFLASDDHELNRQMMAKAQSLGVLTCAVDKNWSDGDFITPASCNGSGLQLAIATGGQSCVRSKSVKNLLGSQLETLASEVILTTFTIDGENFVEKINSDLPASVAGSLKLISGVREFVGYCNAGNFEIVALLSREEQVNRLLRLILADVVQGAGCVIKERHCEEAFAYLLQRTLVVENMQSFTTDCRAECRIGSGLKKLNSILIKSETLKVDPKRGWQEYADYCRKL